MLLPLAAVLFGALYTVQTTVGTLEHIISRPVEDLAQSKEVQTLVLRTELPIHRYLHKGEATDRDNYIRLTVEIDLALQDALAKTNPGSKEYLALEKAQTLWKETKLVGDELLTHTGLADSSVLVHRMDEYGVNLGAVVSSLDIVSNSALAEVEAQRLSARDSKEQALVWTAVLFAIGLLLAFAALYSMASSVLFPIRRLEESIQRFGRGDLSSRIDLHRQDELGTLAGAFNTMAERFQRVQKELEYLSIQDHLTGLFDRGKFHELVNTEIQRAKRYDRVFSILYIDIDDFQKINEKHGHLVGDSVLCSVAMQIKNAIRPTDSAARFGADQFAVMLSETDAHGAHETSERIGRAIAENALNLGDGKKLRITVSIGGATYPDDAEDDTALFAHTDASLAHAKHAASAPPLPLAGGQN